MAATDFCGCCGNLCKGVFCLRCRKHLGPSHLLAWDRTYFAMHGVDCPFQVEGGGDGEGAHPVAAPSHPEPAGGGVDRFEEVKSCWRNATGERFVDDVEWLIGEVERLRKVKASDDLAYEHVAEMYHAAAGTEAPNGED